MLAKIKDKIFEEQTVLSKQDERDIAIRAGMMDKLVLELEKRISDPEICPIPDSEHYYLVQDKSWGAGIFELITVIHNGRLFLMNNVNTNQKLCLTPFDFSNIGNGLIKKSMLKSEYHDNPTVYSMEFIAGMIFNKKY